MDFRCQSSRRLWLWVRVFYLILACAYSTKCAGRNFFDDREPTSIKEAHIQHSVMPDYLCLDAIFYGLVWLSANSTLVQLGARVESLSSSSYLRNQRVLIKAAAVSPRPPCKKRQLTFFKKKVAEQETINFSIACVHPNEAEHQEVILRSGDFLFCRRCKVRKALLDFISRETCISEQLSFFLAAMTVLFGIDCASAIIRMRA